MSCRARPNADSVASETQSLLFLFHPVHDLAQLETLCQRIYFPVNPLSTGELTLFHGMLYFSMWELQCTPGSGLSPDEVQRYRDICWTNFQAGLDTHELAAIPTYENTLALTMAVCLSTPLPQQTADDDRPSTRSYGARRCCNGTSSPPRPSTASPWAITAETLSTTCRSPSPKRCAASSGTSSCPTRACR